MKNRGVLNFVIDLLLFINLAFIAGIGFLMNYTLLPGRERVLKYGDNTELYFLGLDRHQWGDIHQVAGFVLLGLIVLHIIFHWKIIVCLARKVFPQKILRLGLTAVLIVIVSVFLSFTFVITPTKSEQADYLHRNQQRAVVAQSPDTTLLENEKTSENEKVEDEIIPHEEHKHAETVKGQAEIRGSMTLSEVATIYGISVSEVKMRLGLPESLSEDEHLGRLRRTYGLTMTQMRDLLEKGNDK